MLKSALSQGKGSLLGQTGHGKATSWDFSRLFKVFNTQKKWQFTTICDLIKHHFVILIKQQPISGRKNAGQATKCSDIHITFLCF